MVNEVNTRGSQSDTPPADPRLYLRDEELDRGVGLILAGERALAVACERLRPGTGLGKAEIQTLLAIRYQPGLTVSQLRDRLAATVPTFARSLGVLDRHGLISRPRSGEDRRRRQLFLSPQGEDLTQPLASAMRDALRTAYRDAGPAHVAGARRLLEALAK